jgi:hypothetical protein
MYIQQCPVIFGNTLQTEGRSKCLAIQFVYRMFHFQKSASLLTFFYEAAEWEEEMSQNCEAVIILSENLIL